MSVRPWFVSPRVQEPLHGLPQGSGSRPHTCPTSPLSWGQVRIMAKGSWRQVVASEPQGAVGVRGNETPSLSWGQQKRGDTGASCVQRQWVFRLHLNEAWCRERGHRRTARPPGVPRAVQCSSVTGGHVSRTWRTVGSAGGSEGRETGFRKPAWELGSEAWHGGMEAAGQPYSASLTRTFLPLSCLSG